MAIRAPDGANKATMRGIVTKRSIVKMLHLVRQDAAGTGHLDVPRPNEHCFCACLTREIAEVIEIVDCQREYYYYTFDI